MTGYVPVQPPRHWRWRRAIRLVRLVVLLALWVGGTTVATIVWWRGNPNPTWMQAIPVAATHAVLLGAALAHFVVAVTRSR